MSSNKTFGLRGEGVAPGTARGLEAVLFAQIVDAPEALGMAWGEDQERLAVPILDDSVCAQDQRLLAFVGAPGDPHGPVAADLTA